MGNKSTVIGALARQRPEMVFQRSQRADPARELDHHSPGGGGKMEPDHPSPARGQKASGDGEQDERQGQQHDEIRQYKVGQRASPPGQQSKTRLYPTLSRQSST